MTIIKTFGKCWYCENFDGDCDCCRIYGANIPKDTSTCYDGPSEIDFDKVVAIGKMLDGFFRERNELKNYKFR